MATRKPINVPSGFPADITDGQLAVAIRDMINGFHTQWGGGHDLYGLGGEPLLASGNTVYSKTPHSPLIVEYKQPYYSTSLTLRWNKVADDGSRLPRGQKFVAIALAADLDSHQKGFRSSPFSFTLTL
jgi:hypothetical protein